MAITNLSMTDLRGFSVSAGGMGGGMSVAATNTMVIDIPREMRDLAYTMFQGAINYAGDGSDY
jgi:hypothetical protein